MDKQAQDERWQALTEDGRQARIASYKELLKLQKEEADSYLITIEDLEKLYGKHNLNPEPLTPKTWEDVEKEGLDEFEYELDKPNSSKKDSKIAMKCQATLKIAKLIELGYGGMVSEEEALDDKIEKSAIGLYEGEIQLHTGICIARGDRFLMFRSNELGEEFMSHESNRKLIEQYYMI